jgi:hypothetical protein
MSDLGTVKPSGLTFGTSSTNTAVPIGTSTSNGYRMARGNYTVQVTQIASQTATGTSTSVAAAVLVYQVSNDSLGWFPLGSATTLPSTATGTQGAAGSFQGAAVVVSNTNFCLGRAIVTSTGNGGQAWVNIGS